MTDKYVIFSVGETEIQDEPMFWNNDAGWGDLKSADRFSAQEMLTLRLPIDGHWCREIIAALVVALWGGDK